MENFELKILKLRRAELAREGKTLPPREFRRFRVLSSRCDGWKKRKRNDWPEGEGYRW